MPEQQGSGTPPPPESDPTSMRLGELLVGAGAVEILIFACLRRGGQGGAIAAGLFLVIVGLVIRFPTLLSDGGTTDSGAPSMSTMRVAVLLVVSVFAILTVKAGWAATGLDSLRIDPSWAWVLGAVLGGKAVQSFAEWTGKK